jgi:mannose-6-phosphate isomerase-like protein (cupin superfamily)
MCTIFICIFGNGAPAMKPRSRRKRPHQHHFTELGIYVFESRHSEDFTMEVDEWDFHKLCAIVQGNGFLETGQSMVPIGANQVLYLPPNTPHCFRDKPGDPLTLVMVCFYDRTFGGNAAALAARMRTVVEGPNETAPGLSVGRTKVHG